MDLNERELFFAALYKKTLIKLGRSYNRETLFREFWIKKKIGFTEQGKKIV